MAQSPLGRLFSPHPLNLCLLFMIALILFISLTDAHPQTRQVKDVKPEVSLVPEDAGTVCKRAITSPFDYSVKIRSDVTATCPAESPAQSLLERAVTDDDYSCNESKPCSNGACCSKVTGYCNYGPAACGNGQSPNDVCWSNCDAHAECGQYAALAGASCPLNVCCSQYGFCGMTTDFCTRGPNSTIGCQSNCDQPGSGASGGDVQSRVIGYYESWAHDRTCTGMDFKNIPVGGLTHLYFSFGYITPGDFQVAPMDDQSPTLFNDVTSLKSKNSGLKVIVALGGWTFNDPGPTQDVYSDMVSTQANRAKFILNLLSFFREYAFDGVDFDWEYPGAPDRGGKVDDGINFTQFLAELEAAIAKEPIKYVVSFTVPTSYWYLRWFDLKAVNHVDWINVMSYDLHGTWDSINPIGSHVYAHTNMTEIRQAFDLFWRNSVPANKLNLGIGFYGRSFQLSDPSCYKPGCNFLGGASPGACTANSGTLSYKEITQIIEQNHITPYYDEEAGVKYIVWNQDQWVSYDDEVTIKQKLDYANSVGLGGVLIWSVDQDTVDLKALSAILAPKTVQSFLSLADNAAYWADVTEPDCYVTDCGGSCKTGFIGITHQPCGGAAFLTRHSTKADSTLCCPISAAPDPKTCTWRGSAFLCNGQCHDGEITLQLNRWGDGDYCESGNKAYCCEAAGAHDNQCYWTGAGQKCNSGDSTLTFAGTFLETISDIVSATLPSLFGLVLENVLDDLDMDMEKRYCCPPADMSKWKNCQWHGTPGSCDDNHCDAGHQVQLATNSYGLAKSCFPFVDRQRAFCCEATDGESPFLPVDLTKLFKNPPTGSDVDTDFELETDNTWGDGTADTADKEPNDASFGLAVITSPEALQISLDKRDGSHWELLGCAALDQKSEEEHSIKMFCMDISVNSTCHKITLGHGVPGTIVELPKGCGPSRYAVAKTMVVAKDQELPKRLEKRYAHVPVIYDFTFDFEWRRVPRDLGDTQMRVDYSNEVGYWDSVVAAAASKRKKTKKRSLDDFGGSHRRWLEEEWRDDMHTEALSPRELHERWFGSDALAWLKQLFNPNIQPTFTHNIDTSFTAKLIDEKWKCGTEPNVLEAELLVQAVAAVSVATSFGLTIICKLNTPGGFIDLSDSYLFFKNKGDVSATFTLAAVAKARFGTGDIEIIGLQNFPGATFSIPKLITVGPNFKLYGSVDAEVTLSGKLESKVQIASWQIQQSYPDASTDYDPKSLSDPSREGTGSFDGLQQPTFDYSVMATGVMTAHLKPTFEFGITFDPIWNVGAAKADVVADGWVQIKAAAGVSSSGNCPFTYGIFVGADLYASVEAPTNFNWPKKIFPLASVPAKAAKEGGTCPTGSTSARRSIDTDYSTLSWPGVEDMVNNTVPKLAKRGGTYGPLLTLPSGCLFCPNPTLESTKCEDIVGWEPSQLGDAGNYKRSIAVVDLPETIAWNDSGVDTGTLFEKRATKAINICRGTAVTVAFSPNFDSTGAIVVSIINELDMSNVHNGGTYFTDFARVLSEDKNSPNINTYAYTNPTVCTDFNLGIIANPTLGGIQVPNPIPNMPPVTVPNSDTAVFATEHILEFQLITDFLDDAASTLGGLIDDPRPNANGAYLGTPIQSWCQYMRPYFYDIQVLQRPVCDTVQRRPLDCVMFQYPGTNSLYNAEFVVLDKYINAAKEGMWGAHVINSDATMNGYVNTEPDKAFKNVKDVLSAIKYHKTAAINTILVNQVARVGNMLEAMEAFLETHVIAYNNGFNLLPYQRVNLRTKWRLFMNNRATLAKSKAETHMATWLLALQNQYTSALQRASLDPALQTLIGKIDALAVAIAAETPWNLPAF